jgi:hypothetical protein
VNEPDLIPTSWNDIPEGTDIYIRPVTGGASLPVTFTGEGERSFEVHVAFGGADMLLVTSQWSVFREATYPLPSVPDLSVIIVNAIRRAGHEGRQAAAEEIAADVRALIKGEISAGELLSDPSTVNEAPQVFQPDES